MMITTLLWLLALLVAFVALAYVRARARRLTRCPNGAARQRIAPP